MSGRIESEMILNVWRGCLIMRHLLVIFNLFESNRCQKLALEVLPKHIFTGAIAKCLQIA